MNSSFRKNFESFCRVFAEEQQTLVPMISVNNKTAEELRLEALEFLKNAVLLTRINYITQSNKCFNFDDFSLCFKELSVLPISSSLRLFVRPNHKDRYSNMICYFSEHTDILAQIVYFFLVNKEYIIPEEQGNSGNLNEEHSPNANNASAGAGAASNEQPNRNKLVITEDDKKFYCFSTIPAIFLFFVTRESYTTALKFIENLFQLHLFLHEPIFSEQHDFLKDIVFSFFLETGPGPFFKESILPIISATISFVEDRSSYYTKSLCRTSYWVQVAYFVQQMIGKMFDTIAILPTQARALITLIMKITEKLPEMRYVLIVENIICRYIENYIDTPNTILLRDSGTVLKASVGLPTRIGLESIDTIRKSNIPVDKLLEAFKTDKEITNDVSQAVDLAGHFTLMTPRDIDLLYQSVNFFHKHTGMDNKSGLGTLLIGILAPIEKTDSKFIQLRITYSDDSFSQVKLKPTKPFDELVDIVKSLNLDNLQYNSPEELINIIFKFSPISLPLHFRQKIAISSFNDVGRILNDSASNHETISNLSQKLTNSLFILQNENIRFRKQCDILRNIIMKNLVKPVLIGCYPTDFQFNVHDLFSPCNSYGRLIDTITRRISTLGIDPIYEQKFKKSFLLDFLNQIDAAFEFQGKVKLDKASEIIAAFCKENSPSVGQLTPYKATIISRAAVEFQYIKTFHSISFNLSIALRAMNHLKFLDDQTVPLAISISGNCDVFGFIYFVNSYFRDPRITKEIMTEEEQQLIAKLQKICQQLRNGNVQKIKFS